MRFKIPPVLYRLSRPYKERQKQRFSRARLIQWRSFSIFHFISSTLLHLLHSRSDSWCQICMFNIFWSSLVYYCISCYFYTNHFTMYQFKSNCFSEGEYWWCSIKFLLLPCIKWNINKFNINLNNNFKASSWPLMVYIHSVY